MAFMDAGITASDLGRVWTSGFHDVTDEDLLRWCCLPSLAVTRGTSGGLEIGYAAGLNSLVDALLANAGGLHLILGASGPGYQSGFAAVVSR
jgi:hypothetical protein